MNDFNKKIVEHHNLSNKQFSSKVCSKRNNEVVSMERICHIYSSMVCNV